jgi:hypothetical protein
MKKLLTLALALAGFSLYAQTTENAAPYKEYSVSLSENSITLAPGESKQVTVTLLRSKGFSKSVATLGLSSSLPEGVTVSYEPASGVIESTVATISASKEVKAGQYQLILKSTLKNITKGTIVKVTVEGAGVSKDAVSLN